VRYEFGDPVGDPYLSGAGEVDCKDNPDPDVECDEHWVATTVIRDSDAFILAESAANAPGMEYQAQLMAGSNHLQMLNDSEMGKAVDLIFLQGIDGREYFITDQR